MAIIIPSAKIYQRNNPKVRDNIIDRIEVSANKVTVIEDKEFKHNVTILNSQIQDGNKITTNNSKQGSNSGQVDLDWLTTRYYLLLAYSEMKLTYVEIPIKIYVNELSDKTIVDLYRGLDQQNSPYITYTSDYNHIEKRINSTATVTNIAGTAPAFTVGGINEEDDPYSTSEKRGKITLDTLTANPSNTVSYQDGNIKYHYDFSYVPQKGLNGTPVSVNYDIILQDKTNINTQRFSKGTDANGEYFSITLTVLYSREIATMLNDYDVLYDRLSTGYYAINGVKYYDTVKTFYFTFMGETIAYNMSDVNIVIGDAASKNVYKTVSNELMQTSNYYQSTDTNAITKTFSDTLTEYEKGKETCTIRCSLGEYYKYDATAEDLNFIGEKVISVEDNLLPMSFKMYDEVIPMVYGADRKDRPMSKYSDGSPKVFKVLESKIYFNGAVWQELSLQEV